MISVRKTGSEEVIDRMFLCDDIEQGKQYWALARLYMQLRGSHLAAAWP
ncbi:hypothetical protein RK21_02805 [Pseudomonas plecoglossicida]|nr:hypothetical protein RK21_02805 [Pseudomonas plecoglossicida]